MKTFRIALAVAAVAVAACANEPNAPSGSPGQELTPVRYFLGITPSPGSTQWYVALERGFYEKHGLDVEFVPGESASAAPALLESGKADMASMDTTSLTLAKAEDPDYPVRMVAIYHPRAITTIFSLRSGENIQEPADLEGATVYQRVGGTSGRIIEVWARDQGVEQLTIEEADPDLLDRLLITDQVPATASSVFSHHAIQTAAEEAGEDVVVLELREHGLDPFYGIGITASQSFIDSNPEAVKAFVDASMEAFLWCFENPEEAAEVMTEIAPTLPPEVIPPTLATLEEVVTDGGTIENIGAIDPGAMAETVGWVERSFDVQVDPEALYTTQFRQ